MNTQIHTYRLNKLRIIATKNSNFWLYWRKDRNSSIFICFMYNVYVRITYIYTLKHKLKLFGEKRARV